MGTVNIQAWEIGAVIVISLIFGALILHFFRASTVSRKRFQLVGPAPALEAVNAPPVKLSTLASFAGVLINKLQAVNADGKNDALIESLRGIVHDELYALTGLSIGAPVVKPTQPAGAPVSGGGSPPGK